MDSGSGWARMGSLVFAALLGGAAAVGISAAIDGDSDPETVVSTVVGIPPAAKFEAAETGAKSIQDIYEEAGAGVSRRAGGKPRGGANAHAGETAHRAGRRAGGGSDADAGAAAFRGARPRVSRPRMAALRRGWSGS